jgi:DNA mismatch endonuclease (patch repair protein)
MEKCLREKLPRGAFYRVKPEHRRIMQRVKGKGCKTTERRLRAALVRAGIRGWKLNVRGVTGCPDFYFPRQKVAVFVDGCFWHGCPECGHVPKRNSAFWRTKMARNSERDADTTAALEIKGIAVLRFWEHQLRDSLQRCIREIIKLLRTGTTPT